MKNFKEKITGFHYKKTFNLLDFPLFITLFIPSIVYSAIINFKNFLYEIGILKENKTAAKIICIGNITTGGVGKTPVVIEFCKYLSSSGKKVASLSRGYGGKLKGTNAIKDFNNILINNASISGDEVQLIAKNSTRDCNYAVIASSDRLKGADYAKKLGAEIIIMDDGFSNRKIKKDLTLLLFDSKKFIGNGFLLPLGPLRESLKEIKRADGIILIDKEDSNNEHLQNLANFLEEKFKKQIFISKFKIDYFYNIKTNEKISIQSSENIVAFSGIGSPEQFYNYLKLFNLLNTKSFDDHYQYNKADIQDIINKAKKHNARYIITTEKDAVKIKDFEFNAQHPEILAIKLKPELDIEKILDNFKIL